MAAREQAQQTREKKHGSNPGTFSPDDDEAQEADITRADSGGSGAQRNAQGTPGKGGSSSEQSAGDEDAGEEEDVDEANDEDDETPIGTDEDKKQD